MKFATKAFSKSAVSEKKKMKKKEVRRLFEEFKRKKSFTTVCLQRVAKCGAPPLSVSTRVFQITCNDLTNLR